MKLSRILLRFLILQNILLPPAFADPWNLSIDGVPIELQLVEKNKPLRLAHTSVCMGEYDYFRVANFVQVGVKSFEERLASVLAEHVQLCEESKAVVRSTYDGRLKLRDDELKEARATIIKKSMALAEEKERFSSTLLYHRIGLVGAASVIVVLSAVILR